MDEVSQKMLEDALKALETYARRQTYIARMGRAVGFVWNQLSVEARAAISELLDGAPGLDEKTVEWAVEFDEMWEQRGAIIKPEDLPDGSDFVEQIANFTDTKIKTLIAEARLS